MSKAGGIIGIIAGIFGVIAALVTLLFGGLGSAVGTQGAGTVVGLGWGGVLFSFLAIVFGAVVFAKPKGAGIALVLTSIVGAVLGGTLVAIFMALSLVGGILAIVGAKGAAPVTAESPEPTQQRAKGKTVIWIGAGVGLLAVLVVLGMAGKGSGGAGGKADPVAELAAAIPSTLQPTGELAEMFSLGSKNTDLQRENKLKEISGQIVQWRLPVYEVSKKGSVYRVQTAARANIGLDAGTVGTFVDITPSNDADRAIIEALKTGDAISFKGRIAGSTFRSLEIKPAILVAATTSSHAQAASSTVQISIPATPIPSDQLPKKLDTVAGALEHRESPSGASGLFLNGKQLFNGSDASWQRLIRTFAISGNREAVLVSSSGGRGTSCETLYFFIVLAKEEAPLWTPEFGSCSTDGGYKQDGDQISITTLAPGRPLLAVFDGKTVVQGGKQVQLTEDNDPTK